jgi:hypothetical protein
MACPVLGFAYDLDALAKRADRIDGPDPTGTVIFREMDRPGLLPEVLADRLGLPWIRLAPGHVRSKDSTPVNAVLARPSQAACEKPEMLGTPDFPVFHRS